MYWVLSLKLRKSKRERGQRATGSTHGYSMVTSKRVRTQYRLFSIEYQECYTLASTDTDTDTDTGTDTALALATQLWFLSTTVLVVSSRLGGNQNLNHSHTSALPIPHRPGLNSMGIDINGRTEIGERNTGYIWIIYVVYIYYIRTRLELKEGLDLSVCLLFVFRRVVVLLFYIFFFLCFFFLHLCICFANLPSRRAERTREMFFPGQSHSKRHHILPLTWSQLGNRHRSNTINDEHY